jgi:hypothetical protein
MRPLIRSGWSCQRSMYSLRLVPAASTVIIGGGLSTRARKAFSELDSRIRGLVKYGDGSVIEIKGCGTILFVGKSCEHQ